MIWPEARVARSGRPEVIDGQHMHDCIREYRDAGTPVYGLIGDPVAHSLSPVLHNSGFARIGYKAVYLAFRVTDLPGAIAGIRAMDIRGVSVTLPHKVAVIPLLDEIADTARKIGAVNTIVNQNGRLIGTNTDSQGAVAALAEKSPIRGRTVWIVGAGGAARAIGFGINDRGGRVTIVNRSPEKGRRLAEDLGVGFKPLAHTTRIDCDILINATPVGMTPDVDAVPVPAETLTRRTTVMDIVYHPITTRLLQIARKKGCTTVDGAAMLVGQGAAQFHLWTGHPAPVTVMRRAVIEALEEKR